MSLTGNRNRNKTMNKEDSGKLLLRLTAGLLMLPHGLAKLGGVDRIAGMLEAKGLPGVMAYMVYVGEIAIPVLLIIGLFTRFAGVILIINMCFAIYLVHAHQLWQFTKTGGHALELQLFYLMSGLIISLIGPGALSLDAMRRSRFR